jgi:hypothetical protein
MSIQGKRYSVACCVTAILAAAVFGQSASVVSRADINADGRLDVLDVQAIAAEVLARESGHYVGDVNRDGVVDVRDFQTVVAELQEPSPPSEEQPTDESGSKAYFARDGQAVPLLLTCQVLPTVRPARPGPRMAATTRHTKAVEHSVQRFLFHLTPNAPPPCEGGPCLA